MNKTKANATQLAVPGFDWDHFIETFDWPAFRAESLQAAFGLSQIEDDWGIPIAKGGYRITPLHLPLTAEDMQALADRCGGRFGYTENSRYVFKLDGNLLFMVFENNGACDAIVRIEKTDGGFQAVEVLEQTNEDAPYIDPTLTLYYAVKMLSDLLPGCRLGLADDYDESSWFWRQPGDPGYIPDPNPWYALGGKYIPAVNLAMSETIALHLSDEEGHELGPLRWTNEDVEILQTDPRLCCDSLDWRHHFNGGRLLLRRNGSNTWCYLVDFVKDNDGYLSRTAIVNTDPNHYCCCCGEDCAEDIHEAISDLLEKKRAYYAEEG